MSSGHMVDISTGVGGGGLKRDKSDSTHGLEIAIKFI